MSFITFSLFGTPIPPNIEEIIFVIAIFVLVYKNRDTEQLLTHSSVPKGHPIGCFFSALSSELAHVTVEKLIC